MQNKPDMKYIHYLIPVILLLLASALTVGWVYCMVVDYKVIGWSMILFIVPSWVLAIQLVRETFMVM